MAAVLLAASSVGMLVPPSVAQAASFTVTTTTDAPHVLPVDGTCTSTLPGGVCTLRAAVQAANFLGGGPHQIAIGSGQHILTIKGPGEDVAATGDLDIQAQIEITGTGSSEVIGPPVPNSDRVFDILPGASLKLSALDVRDGKAPTGEEGGGIRVQGTLTASNGTIWGNRTAEAGGGGIGLRGGTVTLTNVILAGNSVTSTGGPALGGGLLIANGGGTVAMTGGEVRFGVVVQGGGAVGASGGGIASLGGTLTLTGTRIQQNQVFITAPATGSSRGGGIYNTGFMTLTDVLVDSNLAGGEVGNSRGGGIYNEGTAVITRANLSNNSGHAPNGDTQGGGLFALATGGAMTISNTQVADNRLNITHGPAAGQGGGIAAGGPIIATNLTIYRNTAGAGGGLFRVGGVPAELKNTILAANTGGSCGGTSLPVQSRGFNLVDDASCGLAGSGDRQGIDPQLERLEVAPMPLYPPTGGSPAIDAGDPTVCPSPDLRGTPRPLDGNGDGAARCDIGAFERSGSGSGGGGSGTVEDPNTGVASGQQAEDDTDKRRKRTEEQRQQQQRTNRSSLDDTHTEGNVTAVNCGADPPSVTIANRDGLVVVRLLGDAAPMCQSTRIGDYAMAEGEKQNEQLFDASDLSIKRGH